MKTQVLRFRRLAALPCHLLLSLFAVTVVAQTPIRLDVQVSDPEGRAVPEALVVLKCGSDPVEKQEKTDSRGHRRFDDLTLGQCRLEIAAGGFETARRDVSLTEGANETEVTLRLAAIGSEIFVTSALPELLTERRFQGDEIEQAGSEDLGKFFRGVEGVSAIRRGSVNLEPTIRGLQEEQVGMFVDGTRTFAAGPARMDSNISHVGTHATQTLRIVKGPYALAWGSGTLSALEVVTFRPEFSDGGFQWNGSLGAVYGENNSNLDAHTGVWGASDKLRVYVGGGRREGDDYEAGDGSEVPGDFESTETRWRLGYRPSENFLIGVSGGYQEQFDLDYPGRLLDATYFYARSAALELTWNGTGAVSEVYSQLYSNRKDHRMNNDEKPTAQNAPGRIPPFAIAVDLPTESNTAGGRFKVSLPRDNADWSFGVDYYKVEQTASRTISRRSNGFVLFRDIVWPDAEIEDAGVWGQWVSGGDGYRLGATIRIDEVDATADNLSPFYVANTVGAADQSETNLSAAVSATVDVDDHWSLNFGLGRAVRTATVLERYSDRFPSTKFQLAAEFMGNPELDPEESLELGVGARGTYGDFLIEAEAFYREIDDYITVTPDGSLSRRLPLSPPTVFRYVNGSQASYYGGELQLRHRVNQRLAWRGSVSYVRAEDEALDEPVLGIMPLHGELGLRIQPFDQRLWIDLVARFADRQDRVATSRFERETPGYAVYDLSLGLDLARGWSLKAAVENLSDKAYAEHLNSPNPFSGQRVSEIGRNFKLGFSVNL